MKKKRLGDKLTINALIIFLEINTLLDTLAKKNINLSLFQSKSVVLVFFYDSVLILKYIKKY